MLDIQQFQVLIQLVGNMESVSEKLAKAYENNNGGTFKRAREEIIDIQNKISKIRL